MNRKHFISKHTSYSHVVITTNIKVISKSVSGKREIDDLGEAKSIEEEFTMTLHVIHNEMWHFLLYDFSPHTQF